MARYRKIDTRIWNDNKFNQLSDDSKLLFFFLLTHPHLTAIGAMRISLLGLAGELNWLEERLRQALAELLAKGMVKVDERACFVWLPNFLKYNQPESPNVVKSWEQSLDYLPECYLKNSLIYHVQCLVERLSEGFREALPEAFRKGMPNQEQEQEHKQEQEQNNTTRRSDENVSKENSLKITDVEPVVMITSPSHNHAEQAQCHMESLSGGFQEALPQAFRKGMPNQEQEQEHKQEQEQKNTTRQSVTNFCTEIISEKIANENQVVVIKIPLVGNMEFVVTPSMVEQWQTLYPAVDIVQELRNLCGWNLANPQRRKTKTGIVKHINTWLAKKQNSGGSNYATSYTTRSPPLTSSNTLYGFNIAIGEQWAEEETKIIEGELAND